MCKSQVGLGNCFWTSNWRVFDISAHAQFTTPDKSLLQTHIKYTLYTSTVDLKKIPLPQSWTYASTVSVVNVTTEAWSCHKLFHYLVSWMFTVDIVDCSVLTQLTLLTVDCWLCWQFTVDTVDSQTIFQYWDISQTEFVVLYDDHLLLTICCSSYYGVSMLPLIVSIVARC